MTVEIMVNPYIWAWLLQTKRVVTTAHKEQGKAVIYAHFVIRVVLKAVLYYKNEALQFKKCVWTLCVKAFKRTLSCSF